MARFSNAKEGDKVWSVIHGYGIISEIDPESKYCIIVNFGDKDIGYTLEGKKYANDRFPELYLEKVEIEKQNFLQEYEVLRWKFDFNFKKRKVRGLYELKKEYLKIKSNEEKYFKYKKIIKDEITKLEEELNPFFCNSTMEEFFPFFESIMETKLENLCMLEREVLILLTFNEIF